MKTAAQVAARAPVSRAQWILRTLAVVRTRERWLKFFAGWRSLEPGSALLSAKAGWSRRFDDPIALPNGGELVTLRDAGVYIVALPPREAKQPHWQTTMQYLILTAEKDDIVMLARIAVATALAVGKAQAERSRDGSARRSKR